MDWFVLERLYMKILYRFIYYKATEELLYKLGTARVGLTSIIGRSRAPL